MTNHGPEYEPQPVMLSTNRCPNSGEDWLRVGAPDCNSDALTMWGYCGRCHNEPGRIPQAWLDAIDADTFGGAA